MKTSSMLLLFILSHTAVVSLVHGQPSPDTPDGELKAGGNCIISWTPDKTGVWKTTYIELMAGSNFHMEHITTLATVDGTDPSNHSITLLCPAVTPNAAIYFYQFTSPFAPFADTTWSTRFPIADGKGSPLTPPANSTQPDGKAIPWGTGALTNPSLAVAAPIDVGSKIVDTTSAAYRDTTSAASTAQGGSISTATAVVTTYISPNPTASSTSTAHKLNAGYISGIAIGGVATLALVAFLSFIFARRHFRRRWEPPRFSAILDEGEGLARPAQPHQRQTQEMDLPPPNYRGLFPATTSVSNGTSDADTTSRDGRATPATSNVQQAEDPFADDQLDHTGLTIGKREEIALRRGSAGVISIIKLPRKSRRA